MIIEEFNKMQIPVVRKEAYYESKVSINAELKILTGVMMKSPLLWA
jgi:hypothetical protein